MPSPLPYYGHYTADWAASTTVRLMSCAARGIYRELLDIQWEKEYIEDNVVKLKRLARATDSEWDEFAEFLDECFPVCDDGFRRNRRMEADRIEASKKVARSRANGQKGGRPPKDTETQTKPNGSENNNPGETERLSNEKPRRNRTVSQTITQTKPISESESELDSDTIPPQPPQGAEREPPWWELTEDSLLRDMALAIVSAKGYESDRPPEDRCRGVLDFARKFSPDDDAIREVFAGFLERAASKRKREYEDPVRAIRNWFSIREDSWRRVRRERVRDGVRPKSASVDEEEIRRRRAGIYE